MVLLASCTVLLSIILASWCIPEWREMEEGDRNSSKEVKRGDGLNEEVGPRSGHPKFLRPCKSLGSQGRGVVLRMDLVP